jgi:hypothetical protein
LMEFSALKTFHAIPAATVTAFSAILIGFGIVLFLL